MRWILYVVVSFLGITLVTWMFQTLTGISMGLSVAILILIALGFLCKIVAEIYKVLLGNNRNPSN
ncbi:hypothetical protein M3637_18950 [Paenibacillus illinoisensis]|nr:hypothetical protein [Paenibacillus illinoisensis]